MSASEDKGKRDSGKEGDVVNETGSTNGDLERAVRDRRVRG